MKDSWRGYCWVKTQWVRQYGGGRVGEVSPCMEHKFKGLQGTVFFDRVVKRLQTKCLLNKSKFRLRSAKGRGRQLSKENPQRVLGWVTLGKGFTKYVVVQAYQHF